MVNLNRKNKFNASAIYSLSKVCPGNLYYLCCFIVSYTVPIKKNEVPCEIGIHVYVHLKTLKRLTFHRLPFHLILHLV